MRELLNTIKATLNKTPIVSDVVATAYLAAAMVSFKGDNRVIEEMKAIYLVVPKTGSTSITTALLDKLGKNLPDDSVVAHHAGWKKYSRKKTFDSSYLKFAFVRNPFDRLVSCYQNKIIEQPHLIQKAYGGMFYRGMPFERFVKSVCNIPDWLSELHLRSQTNLLTYRGQMIPDFIGKFENFEKDYAILQQKLGLPHMPLLNTSRRSNYHAYYSAELAEMVFHRYKKDFELFGYTDDYFSLLEKIRENMLC